MLFRYQKAIQNAFREVDDSLISQGKSREELFVEKEHVKSLERALLALYKSMGGSWVCPPPQYGERDQSRGYLPTL
ncbi:MAG: hypothetical protein A4E65_02896 [Syntrophorhabdus sp. PtaU1.Bin153]|nr:MAG: hypothetical protein A4E65_02896 [Syntrophorhabdus sp. PtaU1.Bin153]